MRVTKYCLRLCVFFLILCTSFPAWATDEEEIDQVDYLLGRLVSSDEYLEANSLAMVERFTPRQWQFLLNYEKFVVSISAYSSLNEMILTIRKDGDTNKVNSKDLTVLWDRYKYQKMFRADLESQSNKLFFSALISLIKKHANIPSNDSDNDISNTTKEKGLFDRTKKRIKNLGDKIRALKPDNYTVEEIIKNHGDCYAGYSKVAHSDKCNNREDGYAYAAYVQQHIGSCSRGLDKYDIGERKPKEFIDAYKNWWKVHGVGDENQACKPMKEPAKCKMGVCWGMNYSMGVVFRPSLNLGVAFGKGLGYSDDLSFSGALSSAVLGRFYMFNDMLDIRIGIGIGTMVSEQVTVVADATTEGSDEGAAASQQTAAPTEENKNRVTYFGLNTFGIGGYYGLIAFSYLLTWNPWLDGDKIGHGISLYIDLGAVPDIVSGME